MPFPALPKNKSSLTFFGLLKTSAVVVLLFGASFIGTVRPGLSGVGGLAVRVGLVGVVLESNTVLCLLLIGFIRFTRELGRHLR